MIYINLICMYSISNIMDNIFFRNISYFFEMIAIDSIFSAINFIKTYLNTDLTDQQIVTKSNALYNGSLTDRYIYYFLVYFTYNTICTFFWASDINILYYIGIISIYPYILNKIFSTSLFRIIRNKKELIVKLVIAKILSMLIKFYSKIYLQKKIKNFKYTELTYLLSDYKETVGYFYDVLKNFAIILALSYVKKYSTKIYYDIIKYIYNYKTGQLLDSFNEDNAKEHLIEIIDKKQWHEFKKPNTYNAILRVYQMSISDIDIFKVINDEINFILIKIFSIWTLGSLFGSIYFVPILSLFLILYKYIRIDKKGSRDIIVLMCILPLCAIYDGYFLISFLCQCLPRIIFNKIFYKLSKEIYKNTSNTIKMIDIYDRNIFIPSVSFIGYMIIIKLFELQSILMLFNIFLNVGININKDRKREILYGIIVFTTYLSNFAITHVIFNTIIVFLIDCILNDVLNDNFIDYESHLESIKECKEYLIEEFEFHIKKKDICKKIVWNIIGVIRMRDEIDYTLFDKLTLDTRKKKRKSVVIEDFLLQDTNMRKEERKITSTSNYNIVDNYY
jgi:hypothetical protein